MTNLYDGEGMRKHSGSRGEISYPGIKFGFITAVTPAIYFNHAQTFSKLGGRFLGYALPYSEDDYERIWEMVLNDDYAAVKTQIADIAGRYI